MDKNQSLMLATVIFAAIALLHLARAFLNLPASVSSFNIPVYFSYAGVVIAGFLSWLMYSAVKK